MAVGFVIAREAKHSRAAAQALALDCPVMPGGRLRRLAMTIGLSVPVNAAWYETRRHEVPYTKSSVKKGD